MLQVSPYRLSRHALSIRCIKLALVCLPLIGAYYYSYTQALSPLFCPIKAITGIPCPTCGMTRAFKAIASGNFQQAIQYHLFAPLLFGGLLIAALHLFLEIVMSRKILLFYQKFLNNTPLQITLLSSFFIYYWIRLDYLIQSNF